MAAIWKSVAHAARSTGCRMRGTAEGADSALVSPRRPVTYPYGAITVAITSPSYHLGDPAMTSSSSRRRKRRPWCTFRSGIGTVIVGADGSSDTCRFQSISICRSRSGAWNFSPEQVAADLVCRGKGRDRGRELRRGRNGLWCRASPWSDPAAAVHLAAAAQAAGAGGTRHVRAGGRDGGRTGSADASQDETAGASASSCRWYRA